jgi:hypothetical protein
MPYLFTLMQNGVPGTGSAPPRQLEANQSALRSFFHLLPKHLGADVLPLSADEPLQTGLNGRDFLVDLMPVQG